MSPSTPFVDRESATVDTDQILAEAIPIAMLIGLFLGIALIPLALVFLLGGGSLFGVLLVIVAQFILAVGASIVLMYVIVRALQLADGLSYDR